MSVDYLDGPLGLEAAHIWWPPGGGDPFVINDLTQFPRAKCKKITGIHDLPNADNVKRNSTAQLGVKGFPSYPRDKTITYEGRLQAVNQQALSALRQAFRGAFWDRNAYGTMVINPHADYGSIAWAYNARVLDLTVDDVIPFAQLENLPSDYQRDFILSVEMHDPRYFLWNVTQEWSDLAMGWTQEVTNRGTAEADPIFTIEVAGDPPNITIFNSDVDTSNDTARLRLVDPDGGTIPSGTWVIDFTREQRSITLDGFPYNQFLDSDYSQWWDELIPGIKPGVNHVQAIGGTGTWGVMFTDRSA